MTDGRRRRGAYAKGVAKREEILRRALEVIARDGYAGASVKTIAEAVGLSQAGLLHYFDTKDELFVEILRKRDELDSLPLIEMDEEAFAALEFETVRTGYLNIIEHNREVPGLVELFTRLSADAVEEDHPAHEFFAERQQQMLGLFALVIERAQRTGQVTDRIPAETLARILEAAADGLQQQWLIDPEVDMAGTISALFDLLTGAEGGAWREGGKR